MNKKGFLLAEETLKIILSVIGIIFLAYLLFALYKANSDSKDLELAKDSLKRLFEETSESQSEEVQINNPKGWYMVSWPYNGENLASCSNIGWQSCICICDDKFTTKDSMKECNEAGACLENVGNFQVKKHIEIDTPPITLKINYETKEITRG